MHRAPHIPLVFAAVDGTVNAYARSTGDLTWTFRVPDGELDYRHVTRLAATDNHVVVVAGRMNESGFFATADGTAHVCCLDYATGRQLWHQAIKGGDNIARFTATLLVDGDQVLVAHGSVLAAFELASGRQRWTQKLDRAKTSQHVLSVALAIPGHAEQADAR
jgi:outer membrane protein assembly factor BamB